MARKSIERNISYDDDKKLFYVNLDYGKDDIGKRVKKTKTYKKISDARKALKEHEANKIKNTLIIPKDTTLQQWLKYWMDDIIIPNRAVTTVYGYRNIIEKHILPELGHIPLQKLTPQQVQHYYSKMINNKKLSSNTVRKHHDILKTALKDAVIQDFILKNPIEKVKPPKIVDKEANFYTPEDLRKLYDLVEGNRLEIVVKLAGYLGLRREEICGLSWDNIDFNSRIINIKEARTMAGTQIIDKDPKNKTSKRKLYIADDLLKVLKKEKIKQDENKAFFGNDYIDSGLVVVWENGKPYRPNYISELFSKFIKDNGLPKIVLHGLRHTFASVANSLNVPLYDIGKALGHSTPTVTGKIYTHMFDETHEDTMQKIADKISDNIESK